MKTRPLPVPASIAGPVVEDDGGNGCSAVLLGKFPADDAFIVAEVRGGEAQNGTGPGANCTVADRRAEVNNSKGWGAGLTADGRGKPTWRVSLHLTF